MKSATLQIGDDARQRVCRAANADVEQNDCSIEFRVAFARDPID